MCDLGGSSVVDILLRIRFNDIGFRSTFHVSIIVVFKVGSIIQVLGDQEKLGNVVGDHKGTKDHLSKISTWFRSFSMFSVVLTVDEPW